MDNPLNRQRSGMQASSPTMDQNGLAEDYNSVAIDGGSPQLNTPNDVAIENNVPVILNIDNITPEPGDHSQTSTLRDADRNNVPVMPSSGEITTELYVGSKSINIISDNVPVIPIDKVTAEDLTGNIDMPLDNKDSVYHMSSTNSVDVGTFMTAVTTTRSEATRITHQMKQTPVKFGGEEDGDIDHMMGSRYWEVGWSYWDNGNSEEVHMAQCDDLTGGSCSYLYYRWTYTRSTPLIADMGYDVDQLFDHGRVYFSYKVSIPHLGSWKRYWIREISITFP